MIQRTLRNTHVAIIMDGNGRWALSQNLPRDAGHRAGAAAVRRTIEAACRLGLGTLTLYAFSSDNWRRPEREVALLMRLFHDHLLAEAQRAMEEGIRISVIGRRDRLPAFLAPAIDLVEDATADGASLHLRIAVDYSARDQILSAASRMEQPTREEFSRLLGGPDVDLLIRTGGEQRLSDFLLWECAYAELVFTSCMWPEFAAADLETALHDFLARERRFGNVPTAA